MAGFGLPTVTLGLLALTRPLPEAMALMLVPTLATNIWQSLVGPALRPALRRLWPFLLAAVLGTLAGAGILARSDAVLLSGLLGLLLIPPPHSPWPAGRCRRRAGAGALALAPGRRHGGAADRHDRQLPDAGGALTWPR